MPRPRYRFIERGAKHGVERQAWFAFARGNWTVAYRVMGKNGRPVVAEARVYPSRSESAVGEWSSDSTCVPSGGLNTRMARELVKPSRDLDGLDDRVRDQLRVLGPGDAHGKNLLRRHGLLDLEAWKPHPGSRPPVARDLALAVECAKLREGGVRHVPKLLAEREGVPSGTMRSRLNRLRDKSLLTKDNRLTPRARRLLEDEGE